MATRDSSASGLIDKFSLAETTGNNLPWRRDYAGYADIALAVSAVET